MKCMAIPGTLAEICLSPAWGGTLGPRSVTLPWHLPCSACHRGCSHAGPSCTGAKSQDTGDGHSIKHEEGRSWWDRTSWSLLSSEPEGTACAHTHTRSAVPPSATALVTKVTTPLCLWPEPLHRGRRKRSPCRYGCCAPPSALSPALSSLAPLEK